MIGKLEQIEAFVAVARHGGFAAAAREVRSTRAKVNRLVLALEGALGTPLFLRTTRQVVLTAAGERYFDHCQPLLSGLKRVEQGLQDAEGDLRGSIRLSAPTSFGIGRLAEPLAAFAADHPQIQLDIDFSDSFIDPLADGFDLAIRISEAPTSKALPWLKLREIPMHLVAAPSLLARLGPIDSLERLREAPFIGYSHRVTAHVIRLFDGERLHSFEPHLVLRSSNGEMMRAAQIAGIGCGVLPGFLAQDALASGALQEIAPGLRLPSLWLGLVYPPREQMPRRVTRLSQYLEQRLRA